MTHLIISACKKTAKSLLKCGTYGAGVLHHRVSEAIVSLGFEFQIIGAFEDHSFLIVAHLLVLVAHRVLTVVGDGLRCLFGE